MKELKTLDQHNAECIAKDEEARRAWIDARRNGVACPECGAELYDVHEPSVFYTELPVRCSGCKWEGKRKIMLRILQVAREDVKE